MSSDSPSKPTVAYGSLYLDRGERMKVVKDQIKALAREASNSPLFFDVIYGPGEGDLAADYARRVRDYAAKFAFKEISVSTSFAETRNADPRHQNKGNT